MWLTLAVLFAAAAGGVYAAFQSPAFVAGLSAMATAAAWKAIKPALTKPLSPQDQEAWRKAERQGWGDEWRRRRSGAPPKG
jgi:hypothetical protein